MMTRQSHHHHHQGQRGTPLEGCRLSGNKSFPQGGSPTPGICRGDERGSKDEVFLASLDFHVARISSFIRMMSASVALKSSRESKQRDSLCMLYAMSHITLRVKGLSLAYSHTMGRLGHRARSMRLWDMSWASASMTRISWFESWLLIQWVRALLEAHSSMRAPHEVMHNQKLQVRLIELIDALDNLLYHEPLTDLVPGRTPVHQDSRVKVASLHPALLSESVEGAIVAKL